jgi:hypothetical protein
MENLRAGFRMLCHAQQSGRESAEKKKKESTATETPPGPQLL